MVSSPRQAVRIAVYVLLMASAAATFLFGDSLWNSVALGEVPDWAALMGPATFTLFVIIYAADRWVMVRRSQLSAGRATFQVAFALIFLSLLWPGQAAQFKKAQRVNWQLDSVELQGLLKSRTPIVRALACEILSERNDSSSAAALEKVVASDKDDRVRASCKRALTALKP